MRAFFEKVVNHQKLIITFFVLMALVSGVCSTMVGVNYDMKDYLPEDSPSSVALDVMEENFDEAIPNARVMIKNVSVPEALTYKERLAACEGVSTEDLRSTITADMKKVNFIAIGAVFVVLLFTMQSISLPVILVMAIETAIWMNLSIPYFAGNNVFYIAYLIISSIQLGATVDYAILFTDRYMEERRNKNRKEAIRATAGAVTASVLTSGSVLTVVGFLLGNFSTHGILAQLGMFLAWGALLSLTIVLFVLPGLLYLFDGVIRHTTRGVHRIKELPQEEA